MAEKMSENLSFLRFDRAENSKNFSSFLQILKTSFPYEEQREDGDWQRALADDACHARLYFDAQKNPFAILVFWDFEHCRYVEYFALATNARGNGSGTQILKNFIAENHVPVVLEIEPPELNEINTRRLRFYQKLGFHRVAETHMHPPYHAGFARERLVILNTGDAPLTPVLRERFVHDLETRAMRERDF